MTLSKREAAIIAFMRSKGGVPVTVEQIADFLYDGTQRPPTWRHVVNMAMRTLAIKTMHGPKCVIRKSQLGRGKTGLYVLCAKSKKEHFLLKRAAV